MKCEFENCGPADLPGKVLMLCKNCGRQIRVREADPARVHAMCHPKPQPVARCRSGGCGRAV
jgi:hypothetical protein